MKKLLENWNKFLVEGEGWSKLIVNVFIFKEDKFLMIRRTETAPFKAGAWDIPGGEVEPREAPMAAAIRETEEETQLKVENLISLPKHPDSRRQYYVTKDFSGTIEFLVNPDHGFMEHDKEWWVTFEEYRNEPKKTITNERNVIEAMKVLGLPLPPPYDMFMESADEAPT